MGTSTTTSVSPPGPDFGVTSGGSGMGIIGEIGNKHVERKIGVDTVVNCDRWPAVHINLT